MAITDETRNHHQDPDQDRPAPAEGWSLPLTMLVVAMAYAAGSWVSYSLIHLSEAGAVFFPSAGVSLAALMLSPRARWPAIVLTVAASELVIDLVQGQTLAAAVGFATANAVEPLVGATLLRRASGDELDLGRRRHLRNFVVYAVLAGPLVGGVIGGTVIAINFDSGWRESVLPFWGGDAMGVLTLGAAILAGRHWRESAPVALLALAGTSVLTAIAFLPAIPLAYLSMLPLLWLAFNVSIAALAAAGLGMTLSANLMTALGYGPWAELADTPNVEVATLQLFLAISLLAAWLLAVGVREKEFDSRRYYAERSSALELQRAMLPQIPAMLGGVPVGALYRPGDVHHEVGGDWYDVFAPRPGCVALVVGDIVGHDLTAAAAMGRTHPVVRLLASQIAQDGQADSPGEMLERLDEACVVLPEAAFSTVGFAEFTPAKMRLRFACAGHPPPLLVDDSGARFLWEGRSTPVGIPIANPAADPNGLSPNLPRASGEIHLSGPARLVWFTDGLIERPGVPLEQALERLRAIGGTLDSAASPDAWCARILTAMVADQTIEDDIVVLCADLQPPAPNAVSEVSAVGAVGRA